jgi:hypothetical protein
MRSVGTRTRTGDRHKVPDLSPGCIAVDILGYFKDESVELCLMLDLSANHDLRNEALCEVEHLLMGW